MSSRIAVVGVACRYPDADSPAQLWENVLAGRRAFRRIPDERLRREDYWSADPAAPDRIYSDKAAVLEGFEFDRVKFKIAGSTYRSTDLTHWLALDTAAKALDDAGYPGGAGLPRERTGVIVGNTLTGEFSRANLMRLRWPYVRRVVATALRDHGWDDTELAGFLAGLEPRYKDPFPAIDEDTLAGGLANTIAGRLCNYYDFKGGGYTVDGACSSSLLSVATACNALSQGQLDAAVAGGVDLSIDPFELVGFAKTGALATGEMRVYDRKSNGFWPGEGCGMLVLLRQDDADAAGLRSYASIVGWGYSSDGKGGITRPEAAGHRLAIERAYQAAGFDIGTVAYLEGHGTGTAVGDATELRAFAEARRQVGPNVPSAALSTVKGNIGHTKAAAGVAGLLKATMAVYHQVIPPATSHVDPHPALTGADPGVRVPLAAESWPAGQPVRAGISSMGFGGINTHIVLEGGTSARPAPGLDARTVELVRSRQDCELLLLDADSPAELRERLGPLAELCARLSYAELGDMAAALQRELRQGPVRAAVVASAPEAAAQKLTRLITLLDGNSRALIDPDEGVFLGGAATRPRIGYLFPGQGSGRREGGGALALRFDVVGELYQSVAPDAGADLIDTAAAQPRIVTSSAAGLRALAVLGIEAVAATGHSLGELTSLHWAGALTESQLLRLAGLRGRAMAEASRGGGTMASIDAAADRVEQFLGEKDVVIAGYNSPRQTVVSGPAEAVDRVCRLAVEQGLTAARLPVSHAFHSDLVAPAAHALDEHLAAERFQPLRARVVSTVTADTLAADTDVRELLVRQVREPVRFSAAVSQIAADIDLLVEVGPGRVLSRLAHDIAGSVPVIAMDTDAASLAGMLSVAGAAWALGAPLRHDALFRDRFTRQLPLDKELRFLASPCETPPPAVLAEEALARVGAAAAAATEAASAPGDGAAGSAEGSLEVLRRLAAERAELPLGAVTPDTLPLDDLHLSSITVGQIMNLAARELGLGAPMVTSNFAIATLAQLADTLDELGSTELPGDGEEAREPDGVAPWVRAFTIELTAEPEPARVADRVTGAWQVFASQGHPLAAVLADALREAELGDGVLLCLPADCDERHVGLMLDAAHAALARSGDARFVVIQDRRGAVALAKTLHLEAPAVRTTVVRLPLRYEITPQAAAGTAQMIAADVAATGNFREVSYDEAGARAIPRFRLAPVGPPGGQLPLGRSDVLLVTGGGKGITAECALAIAQDSGASVALLGRSDPASDAELDTNLRRMEAAGLAFRYIRADVTSADEVKAAVEEIATTLGPVTAVLHGAGRNEPVGLASLDDATFQRTLAPKIVGLENVLTAADPGTLRLLVTFGSIIGRAGLRGEAHYATANDWLTDMTSRVQDEHPQCRCLALEWSVWSGAGMGERLGVLESLIREGIMPIPPQDGIAILRQVLASPQLPTTLVIMGRAGGLATISLEPRELPLMRFVDQPRAYYPGIELVVDAELSADSDLYLADHLLDGDLLFPAVLGMEAMAQVGGALAGQGVPVLENLEFLRPIVVPADGSATIRIAALNHGGRVEAVIRSSETGFQTDHFRAVLRYPGGSDHDGRPTADDIGTREAAAATASLPQVPLTPGRDLYGEIMFQGRRFQRVLGYRQLAAKSCTADISGTGHDSWFGVYLPGELILGDPGTRDALMHGIQGCVPNATLLPEGVDRIWLAAPRRDSERVVLHAAERHRDGDSYTYDVEARDTDGILLERWEGLRLHAVRKTDGRGPWAPALLGPYLERQAADLLPAAPRCVVEPDSGEGALTKPGRRAATALAVSRIIGAQVEVRYRADGKPEVDGDLSISASHGAGVTLAVAGHGRVACDVEKVGARSEPDWLGLLGRTPFALAQMLARERREAFPAAATRVWTAVECLRKTGHAAVGPITLDSSGTDAWTVLRAGSHRIATFVTSLRGVPEPVVFAILTEGRP